MEQALKKRGLSQLKSVHHTRQLSSQMFQNFKNMMLDKKLELFDHPIPEGAEHSAHIQANIIVFLWNFIIFKSGNPNRCPF